MNAELTAWDQQVLQSYAFVNGTEQERELLWKEHEGRKRENDMLVNSLFWGGVAK